MGKLAPGFRTILSNSEGPLMDLFTQFVKAPAGKRTPPSMAPNTARNSELPETPFTPSEAKRE